MTSGLRDYASTAYAYITTTTAYEYITWGLSKTAEKAIEGHNWAKTVEKANLGKHYITVAEGFEYYVVDRAAKPAWSAVSEQYSKHPYLYSAGLVILALLARKNFFSPEDKNSKK